MYKKIEICIAACFYYTGLIQLVCWWKQHFRQSLVILTYHRATQGNLRQHLLYLHQHYRILHLEMALEELYSPHQSKRQNRDRRTPLVVTFDDGYHDNYTHAFQLARELNIPLTFFLVPGYIESGNRFWWLEGEYLVSQAQVSTATIEGHTYHLDKADERKILAQTIDTHVRHATSIDEREEFLACMHKILVVPSSATSQEEQAALPLTWTEVQAMKESGWVSFGAHTMHHPILAYLTDSAEVQHQVRECRVVLEQQLGCSVRTFAYPVGRPEHIGQNGLCAVLAARYDWAVTTIYGFNTPLTQPLLLRRIVVDTDQHWLAVAAKACGVWGFFSRLCWHFITLFQKNKRSNMGLVDPKK
ncbi:MAG: hypothetical protein NVS4B12_05020 [Ktedonobacteraceae bacterium]